MVYYSVLAAIYCRYIQVLIVKAVILSAGQGRRLLPSTARTPKCALPIHGRALIEWQLDALEANGIERVVVVAGFGVEHVEGLLARRNGNTRTRVCHNPFFEVSDNLMSCWIARQEMTEDFILLNGDTLFEPAILERLLSSPQRSVTLATDHKPIYDADDMKVQLSEERLLRVGKDLAREETDGESIGLMLFRGKGPELFKQALEQAARDPGALSQWYLSIIAQIAESGHVWTRSIAGLGWAEVDYPLDLLRASAMVADWRVPAEEPASPEGDDLMMAG